jgi:hypothetical protein
MFPPVDPLVLQRNPNFEVLYKDLTTRKLNPNASTRDTKKQRVHDEIRKVCVVDYIKTSLPYTRSIHTLHLFRFQTPTSSNYPLTHADIILTTTTKSTH